jgi:hypothetical protein
VPALQVSAVPPRRGVRFLFTVYLRVLVTLPYSFIFSTLLNFSLSFSFSLLFFRVSPTVAVEWLILLLHVREILGSNLGPETGSSRRGFLGFPQSFHSNTGIVPSVKPQPLPSISLPMYYLSCRPMLYSPSY